MANIKINLTEQEVQELQEGREIQLTLDVPEGAKTIVVELYQGEEEEN